MRYLNARSRNNRRMLERKRYLCDFKLADAQNSTERRVMGCEHCARIFRERPIICLFRFNITQPPLDHGWRGLQINRCSACNVVCVSLPPSLPSLLAPFPL